MTKVLQLKNNTYVMSVLWFLISYIHYCLWRNNSFRLSGLSIIICCCFARQAFFSINRNKTIRSRLTCKSVCLFCRMSWRPWKAPWRWSRATWGSRNSSRREWPTQSPGRCTWRARWERNHISTYSHTQTVNKYICFLKSWCVRFN